MAARLFSHNKGPMGWVLLRVLSVIHSLWAFLLPSGARRGGKLWGLKLKTFPTSRRAPIAENRVCVMVPVECSSTHGDKRVPREWGRLLEAGGI